MPDTHATRFTDTARMIPDRIPIPLTSIDNHLRAAIEHLITLLINKKKPIGPYCKPSTKQELLCLAQILQRDTTSPLQPLPTSSTSTKKSPPSTSSTLSVDNDNATVSTSNASSSSKLPTSKGWLTNKLPTYIMPPTHAALYSQTSPSSSLPSNQSHSTSKKSSSKPKSPYHIDIINKDKLNKFLKAY